MTFAVQDGAEAGQTVWHTHLHCIPRKGNDFPNNDDIYVEVQFLHPFLFTFTRLKRKKEKSEQKTKWLKKLNVWLLIFQTIKIIHCNKKYTLNTVLYLHFNLGVGHVCLYRHSLFCRLGCYGYGRRDLYALLDGRLYGHLYVHHVGRLFGPPYVLLGGRLYGHRVCRLFYHRGLCALRGGRHF